MKHTKLIAVIALIVLLGLSLTAVIYASVNGMESYNGSGTDVTELYAHPDHADVSDAEGVADIIVAQNLEKTNAANNVAAVVFDFRGFDTLGESFILLTAIAGSFVILGKRHRKEGSSDEV